VVQEVLPWVDLAAEQSLDHPGALGSAFLDAEDRTEEEALDS
jgi:hypothetical protein